MVVHADAVARAEGPCPRIEDGDAPTKLEVDPDEGLLDRVIGLCVRQAQPQSKSEQGLTIVVLDGSNEIGDGARDRLGLGSEVTSAHALKCRRYSQRHVTAT